MNVEFRKSFEKDLDNLRDTSLLQKIKSVIEEVENAVSLAEVNNVKKLKADGKYYRIKEATRSRGYTDKTHLRGFEIVDIS